MERFFEEFFNILGGHVSAGDEKEGDEGCKHNTKGERNSHRDQKLGLDGAFKNEREQSGKSCQ